MAKLPSRVAVHEAGHAVVAWRYRQRIKSVSICRSGGGCESYFARPYRIANKFYLRADFEISVAGAFAESIVFGGHPLDSLSAEDSVGLHSYVESLVSMKRSVQTAVERTMTFLWRQDVQEGILALSCELDKQKSLTHMNVYRILNSHIEYRFRPAQPAQIIEPRSIPGIAYEAVALAA